VSNQEFGFWKLRRFHRFRTWKKAWVRCRFVHDTSTATRDPRSRELESSMKQQVKSQQKHSNCVRLFRNALKGGACGWSLDSGESQSSAIERPLSTIFDKR
jgi:hypothetical protein